MYPHADREIDEDLRKGAVESLESIGDPSPDQPEWLSGSIALTEDVTTANSAEVKQAEEELGADEDGTPG
ncbi:MAG TPA: hypothetical protein VI485_22480 [Vicinamibacterales bacterium]|nr:hypothetical protein [Vicinamibacterales bacterium]